MHIMTCMMTMVMWGDKGTRTYQPTFTPSAPSSAASARPAGPQPTTHTSSAAASTSSGGSTSAMLGCLASSLLACTDGALGPGKRERLGWW